ncbi:MAG: sugar-binding domain-containing protein, partial [Phycisphaerae bacterium]
MVKDRPAVLQGMSAANNYRLSFKARCLDGGKLGQIWFSPHYQGEFQRYAVALRSGLLNDLFLLRYREKDFPESTVGIANCYPLGFEPDTNHWITFRIEVRGPRMLAWVGDVKYPQLDYTDPKPLSEGTLALGGSWHACEFAEVKLEKLDAGEPLDLYAPNAIKIRFSKKSDPCLRNWKISNGEVFDATRGFGWDRDLSQRLVQRDKVPCALQDGLFRLSGKDADALFSVALPDGEYYVTATAGDPMGYGYFHATVQDRPLMDVRLTPMQYTTEPVRVRVQGGVLKLKLFSMSSEKPGIGNPLNSLVIEPWAEAAPRVGDKELKRQRERAAYQPQPVTLPASGPSRLSLEGRWLFMPAQDVPVGIEPQSPGLKDEDWHVVNVPSFWNTNGWWIYTGGRRVGESYQHRDYARVASQTFDFRTTREAWYRQWLRFGAQEKGRRYTIRFDAAASIAEVYFNGKHVGGHVGMFAPFELDVTDQIRWGAENLLAVKVTGEPQKQHADADKVLGQMITMIVTPEHVGSLPRGIIYSTIQDLRGQVTNERPGGLWQPVSLLASGEARINSYFFKPRIDGASIEVELLNRRDAEVKANLIAQVAGVQAEQAVTIPAGKQIKVMLDLKAENLKLWSPEHPNLYPLTVRLSEGATQLDERQTQVGFRTTETRGDKFYLNGRPYWLGGANGPVHGLAPLDEKLADRFMGVLAKMHVRCTRTHSTPMTHVWLEASDRNGVGVGLEGPWSWVLSADTNIPEDTLWETWRQEMLGLVKDLRNHPSILLWTVSNENHIDWDPNLERRVKKWRMWEELMRAIKAVDPTRPVCAFSGHERADNRHGAGQYASRPREYFKEFIQAHNIYDGDFVDEHRYIGHYSPSIFSYQYNEHSRNIGMGLPVISQEASTGYPNGDTGHLERKYIGEYVPQAWVGRDAYDQRNPQPYLEHVALMSKEWMEKVRRDRDTAGWQMFNCANWFRHPYDAEAIEAYPTAEAARLALQPVLISLEMRDRHALAGSMLKGTLHVINDQADAKDLSGLRCQVNLRDAKGKVLSEKEVSLPDCAYFKSSTAGLELAVPENLPFGPYTVTLQLRSGQETLSENRYTLKLGSSAWADAPAKGLKAGGVNLSPQLTAVLGQMGLTLETSDPWKSPVMVWGGNPVPTADSPEGRKLLDYVQGGGKLLLLETGQAGNLLPGIVLPETKKDYLFAEYVEILDETHPVFAGVGRHDLGWWNGQGKRPEAASAVYTLDTANPAVTCLSQYIEPHIGEKSWARAFRAPLFAVKQGSGQLIVCDLRVSAAASDPIARRLLANLL